MRSATGSEAAFHFIHMFWADLSLGENGTPNYPNRLRVYTTTSNISYTICFIKGTVLRYTNVVLSLFLDAIIKDRLLVSVNVLDQSKPIPR